MQKKKLQMKLWNFVLGTEKFLRDLVHRLHFQIWFSAALTREFANIAEVIIKKWIGGFYTRYADDMLFSSAGTLEFDFCKNKNFKRMIAHILHQNGFSCNESKTIYAKGEISLSGYVVSNDVHLSRQKLCNINEVIYQFDQRKSYGSISYSLDKATVNIKNIMCNLNKRKMKRQMEQ